MAPVDGPIARLRAIAGDCHKQRALSVLVVHEELPTYDRQSGSLRLQRYVEFMVADGHRVTFVGRAGWEQERYADELRALGVEVHPLDHRRLRDGGHPIRGVGFDLPLLLARGRFDLAYLNFYGTAEQYLPDIRALSPATRILIDTHDVHHVRERRGAELSGDEAALAAAERTRQREAAIYSQADLLTAVSEDDARALRELAPDVPIEIVTNVHLDVPPGPPLEQRRGLVFVANFDHRPNVDAILDFYEHSWPLVARQLPDATLTIVGWAPPPEVRSLASERVTVTGQVPEVAPYLDAARVSIAPLRYGAGVKGKIGEALMHGLPVVTTTIGAEGMGLVDGEHVLIAEPGERFAQAVVRLHQDATLWQRLATAGRAHVDARHGVAAGIASMRRAFASAVPACVMARCERWTLEAADAVVGGYLSAFSEGEAVTLAVPVIAGRQAADDVLGLLGDAVGRAGADPEHIPDIAVMPSLEDPPVPARAVALRPEEAASFDWRAAAEEALAPGWPHDEMWPSPRERADAPRASIVIPAYGRREMTERCLAALERDLGNRLGSEIELVLVDNHSPDSTLELFRRWEQRATVVALERNLNFAGGVNAGARAARGAVLIVVSTDMELGAGAIDALIEEVLKPGVGLVGARMRYPDGRLQHAGIAWRPAPAGLVPFHVFHYEEGDLPAARATLEMQTVTGGCIAVRADLFELVGGLDEGYVNGWEDADLCLRIGSTGATVRCLGDVDIVHHEGATSGRRYDNHGNSRRFYGRWGSTLSDDERLLRAAYGAIMNPITGLRAEADAADGAPLRIIGPVCGIGPRGAEARGLVQALLSGGVDVAWRTVAPTWVAPSLDEPRWRQLALTHTRPNAPGATTIGFGDMPSAEDVLRAGVARRPVIGPEAQATPATAWAACPAAADRLLSAGWRAECVELLAPVGIEAEAGDGGHGALVLVPTHDRRLTARLLDGLRELGDVPVAVLPSVRTPEIHRQLHQSLPGATLLAPTTDERALASLAARSDIVVALDPDDEFDRQALVAAAAGAPVVVRRGGAAAWVLGELALAVDPASVEPLRAVRGWADRFASDRQARSAAVSHACGVKASVAALRELTGSASAALRAAA